MLTDYCERYYYPLAERNKLLTANNGALARGIAAWKKQVSEEWNNIKVISFARPDATYTLTEEAPMRCEVELDLGRLKPEDIGVEILFSTSDKARKLHISEHREFALASFENGVARYAVETLPERTGLYHVGIRVFPRNPLLPHRQDLPLVKWL